MIYITFKQSPILPPEIDFRILVVACPTLGFLVLALTAIPINGAVALIADFRIFFQAVCVPLKIFCNLLFIDPPSSLC